MKTEPIRENEVPLTGLRVLVVEDDYFIAADRANPRSSPRAMTCRCCQANSAAASDWRSR